MEHEANMVLATDFKVDRKQTVLKVDEAAVGPRRFLEPVRHIMER